MFVSPMLLERINEPFNSDEYITELKLDGIRLLLTKFNDKIRLYTRHNNEVTSLFSELLTNLSLPDGTVLDGELIVPGKDGKPDFEAMMSRFKSKKSGYPIQFCVFDIIYYNGNKINHLPLLERKNIISELEPNSEKIVPVQWMVGHGIPYFNLVQEQDLEGIVLKKINSTYKVNSRTDDWLKVINYKYKDILITGLLKKDKSFLISSIEDNQPLGIMEFVPTIQRKEIYDKMRQSGFNEDDNIIKLNNPISCNVKFRNWTSNGKLRIPSFHKWIS